MSQIIIEVAGGAVQSVYHSGPIPAKLEVLIVDLDAEDVGEEVAAEPMEIESILRGAPSTREAVADYNKK